MKKYKSILVSICLMCIFAVGCSQNTVPTTNDGRNTAQNVMSATNETNNAVQDDTESSVIDYIDLTALSATMVYAEVYNMMISPSDYIGKTVKMSGSYSTALHNETGVYYHYVLIEDAAACCQSGIEFILKGEYKYPEDYPKEQTEIEVVGIFESYEEFGEIYYRLVADDILVLG